MYMAPSMRTYLQGEWIRIRETILGCSGKCCTPGLTSSHYSDQQNQMKSLSQILCDNKRWTQKKDLPSLETHLKSSFLINSTMMSFSGWICSIFSVRQRNGVGLMFPPKTPPTYFSSMALSTTSSAVRKKKRNISGPLQSFRCRHQVQLCV